MFIKLNELILDFLLDYYFQEIVICLFLAIQLLLSIILMIYTLYADT